MSKLEQLINELCPDGVPIQEFGKLAKILRGASPRPIKKFITSDEDGINWIKIGDINTGDKYVTNSKEKITEEGAKKSRFVKKGDFILSNSMSFGRPYILAIDGCIHDGWLSISGFEKYFISDFLYHLLSSSKIQKVMSQKASSGGAVQNLNAEIVKSIELCVPPLQVQEEIVRILDTFTELTAELTAELIMRKQQYEYYRDSLLTFGEEVEWKTLGEVGDVKMCKRILKNQTSDIGDVPFYKIGTFGKEPNAYISRETFEEYKSKYSYPKIGEVLISASGTIGRTVIFDGQDSYFQDSNIVWIDNDESQALNKYLFHFYKIVKWAIAEGGTIQRLYNDNLKKTKIPLPPLEEQQRTVDILDRFDTLVNDIKEGLPAEIAARKQQYEYYRDKLLTFKKLEV